jgi:outer membrane protein assembly factor BamA
MTKRFFIITIFSLLVMKVAAQTRLVIQAEATGDALAIITSFPKAFEAVDAVIAQFPVLVNQLQAKGYWEASVDQWVLKNDTVFAGCWIGKQYNELQLQPDSTAQLLLKNYQWKKTKTVSVTELDSFQNHLLNYLSELGYPFAKVEFHNVQLLPDPVLPLKIEAGPMYSFDSIINVGPATLNHHFISKYLQIEKGTLFQPSRMREISNKLNTLDFIEQAAPPQIQLTGTGAILQLNLKERKVSQFDFLIGLLPATDEVLRQKLLITGEANILLKNEFGGGESIGLTWQQLQPKSPRLQIIFDQPYIFKTNWGVSAGFQLFKKDSSFLTIQLNAGLKYAMGKRQVGTFFVQQNTSNIIGLDTNLIKSTKALPPQLDVRSTNIGLAHEYNGTDYLRNPRKGMWWMLSGSAGLKQVKQNAAIAQIKDPSFDYTSLYDTIQLKSYQFRLTGIIDKYLPVGKASTIKLSTKAGWYQSPQIYRNELFQIGGFKLLRGFDEESIYVSGYAVATFEYRYLIGRNAYLFGFADAGWVKSAQVGAVFSDQMLSGGMGIYLETRAGVIQMALAAGKRKDQNFDIRQAKIHLGYVNYF